MNINGSLFILDKPGNTFMYEAIYKSIPFLLFFNRLWQKYFTKKFNDFLDYLNKNKILYYWDNLSEMKEAIQIILKNSYSTENFKKCRQYLKNAGS